MVGSCSTRATRQLSVSHQGGTALSIVVITRHRPACVTRLLVQLIDLVQNFCGDTGKVRILVSDSSDDNQTFDALTALSADLSFCTIRKATQSFRTAEEHLHDALGAATGIYVWTLADDDMPTETALSHIFTMIGRHDPGIMLINPPFVSQLNGTVLWPHYVAPCFLAPANGQDLVMAYRDLVRSVGLIHLNCLVSSLVFRREPVMKVDWHGYFNISPIYAHSMALLDAFHNERAVFTNRHIFSYGFGAVETNNIGVFDRLAEKLNVSNAYFWTSALTEFLTLAIRRGYLSENDVQTMREVHWEERSFPMILFISHSVCRKLRADLQGSGVPRLPLTVCELDKIEAFLVHLPPVVIGLFERLIRMVRVIYPLLLAGGHADQYGYDDLGREMSLFAGNEQAAIRNEISAWALQQIVNIEGDAVKIFSYAV
jgi:hypothetical protein